MNYLRDILDSLGIPYRFFGHDSAMSEVINYALAINEWMKNGGKDEIKAKLKIYPLAVGPTGKSFHLLAKSCLG